jgi:hypothetical protein
MTLKRMRNGLTRNQEILVGGTEDVFLLVGPSEEGYVAFPAGFFKEKANILAVELSGGIVMEVASFHEFLTMDGWKKASALDVGEGVVCYDPSRPHGIETKRKDLMGKFLKQPGLFLRTVERKTPLGVDDVMVFYSDLGSMAVGGGGVLFRTLALDELEEGR